MYNKPIVTMADGTVMGMELDFDNTHHYEHIIEEWPEEVESVTFEDDEKKETFDKGTCHNGMLSNMSKVGMAVYSAINWTKDPIYPRHVGRVMPRYVNSVRKEGHLSIHDLSRCHGNYKFVRGKGMDGNLWHIRRVYLDTPLCEHDFIEAEDTRLPVPEPLICSECLNIIREYSGMTEKSPDPNESARITRDADRILTIERKEKDGIPIRTEAEVTKEWDPNANGGAHFPGHPHKGSRILVEIHDYDNLRWCVGGTDTRVPPECVRLIGPVEKGK